MFSLDRLIKRRRVTEEELTPLNEELERRSQLFLDELLKDTNIKTQEKYEEDLVKDLKDLGFSCSKNVTETNKFNRTIQTVLQSIQFIEQVKDYFGASTLVIKNEDLMYLIDKYDLVCGPFDQYLGYIPPEKTFKIKESKNKIDFFRNLRCYKDDYEFRELWIHYNSYRLIYLNRINHRRGGYQLKNSNINPQEVTKRLLRFGMFLVPDDERFVYKSLGGVRDSGRNCIEDDLGLLKDSTYISDVDLTHKGQHLFICAPSKDMNVDFSSKIVKYPDPLICSLGVNNSVVIHTMWGPESEDSILGKYK